MPPDKCNKFIGVIEILESIYRRLTAGGSTAEQAVQSGFWVTGINVADRTLQLLKVVILARILSPEAFGLLGIALLTIAALNQFSKLGFDEALIQNTDENVDDYLNTAWLMKAIRGLTIALISILSAPHLAGFFGEPRAELLIQLIGVSSLVLGLQNPAVVYFQKHLNFHREFIYQVGGRIVDLLIATIIALVFESAWALAAGIVSMNFMKFSLSYFIHEYSPKANFDISCAKDMFGFGKWMFASAILVFLYSQGDDAFVGWFFGASALGVYQLAYRFSNAPATEVTHVISRVAFPAFSKIQDDPDQLRKGFVQTTHLSTMVSFPIAIGIIVVSHQFVYVVFGDQWEQMVPLLQILSLWGMLRAFGANFGAVFKAVGKPNYEVRIHALKVILIILTIYPASEYFGIIGVGLVIVGNAILEQPIALYYVLSITNLEFKKIAPLLIFPAIGCFGMAAIVVGIDWLLLSGAGFLELIVLILSGIISYITSMLVIERFSRYEFLKTGIKIIQSF
jgi:O-antigen/teichoic acid export membrane protein